MTDAAPKRPYVSVAQVRMIEFCGPQYDYRYVQGLKVPPGIALIVGRGTHKGAEVDLRAKATTGELLPLDVVTDAARDEVREAWLNGVHVDEDERDVGLERLQADAIDDATALAALYHREVAPGTSPRRDGVEAVERWFRIELPHLTHDVAGYLDLDEGAVVRDLKTTRKTPHAGLAATSSQLATYGLAKMALGEGTPAVQLDTLVRLKGGPKVHTDRHALTQADLDAQANRIVRAIAVINSGMAPPARSDDPMCSAKFCGFHSICPYARGRVAVAVPR